MVLVFSEYVRPYTLLKQVIHHELEYDLVVLAEDVQEGQEKSGAEFYLLVHKYSKLALHMNYHHNLFYSLVPDSNSIPSAQFINTSTTGEVLYCSYQYLTNSN